MVNFRYHVTYVDNEKPKAVSMPEHLLFLTGKLAEKNLRRVLDAMQPTDFTWHVHELGVSVAALMTTDMIKRRLKDTFGADRIMLPGRCRGDIDLLSRHFDMPVERGPEELKDLPAWFGGEAIKAPMDKYHINILAEIVDASQRSTASIIERAEYYRDNGADIIDLGFLPDTPFPHLEEAVQALKEAAFKVSVDTLDPQDLIRGARAGADYLLSLTNETLWVADEVDATPVLIPIQPNQPDSLYQAMETLTKKGRHFIADPILDPIHSGFTRSLVRYHATRKRFPDAQILMGVGNLTELTHADSAGINMLLLGIMSELKINYMLTTEVSPHCRRAVREADHARRILHTAHEDGTPPRLIDDGLMALHERKPFPYAYEEILELAKAIKDPSYRIQISERGVHLFNRDSLHTATDPFDLYPHLDVKSDAGHAFYLGVEMARAQIAWQLGKQYTQDSELDWGIAVERKPENLTEQKQAGPTLQPGRKIRRGK
jgi:dihydropteroate synthase